MGLRYYSELPMKMPLYVFITLALVIVGFAALIGPFIAAYFTDEKYNIEVLHHTDQELEAKHEAIWQDLELSWKQFWVNKIQTQLVDIYSFSDELENNLAELGKQKLEWGMDEFLEFYNKFLQGSPNVRDINDRIYYYLIDHLGNVKHSRSNRQPNWRNFGDLGSLDALLYFDYDISKVLRYRSNLLYLQYNMQLGLDLDSMNVVSTLFFYDPIMEERNLRFAVSMEMGTIFEQARDFFRFFAGQRQHWGNSQLQTTTLFALDESEDGSWYFKAYGSDNRTYDLKLSRDALPNALYRELAATIISVAQPASHPALADPSLNFLLNIDDKEERGKRLELELQIQGYMKPFIVSNLYGSLGKRYALKIISVGKVYMLPPSHNLVVLKTVIDPSWWSNKQFFNIRYYSKLSSIVFLFLVFLVILLVPLLFYGYFVTRYAKEFFQIRQYVKGLPSPSELVEKHEAQNSIEHKLSPKIEKIDAAIGQHLIWEVQQRFAKLVEAVDYWREQSSTDELTGLLNRKGLNQICSYEFSRMKRSGSSFSLILLDIDYFKGINDTYGHEAGDLVLKSLADVLVSTFRASDSLGRWGGEEFLIVLPDTGLHGAIQVAEEARLSVEEMLIQMQGASLRLTVSIGVASSSDGASFDATLNFADKSLYQAKENGRNQVWGFREDGGYFAVVVKREGSRKVYDEKQ